MRWVRVDDPAGPRIGVVVDSAIHCADAGVSLNDLLVEGTLAQTGARLLESPVQVRELESVRLLAPLVPASIRDCVGHLGHIANCQARNGGEVPQVWRDAPQFYFGSPATVLGPGDPVPVFPGCQRFDYELEMAVVIGTAGRDLHPQAAMDHVAGLLLFGDWSARDLQLQVMACGLGPSKGKDGATTLGPWFVEVADLEEVRTDRGWSLPMSVSLNGARMGGGDPGTADFSVGEILSYCSQGCELVPGDVIATGTVPTGCLLELERLGPSFGADRGDFQQWLQIGDVVELDGGPLGRTRQEVVAGAEPIWSVAR